MKPGVDFAYAACLPHASDVRKTRCATSGAVSSPLITSTSRMRVGGLKKCIPTTRSGCFSPAAIAVTDSDEVLVARMQRGPTMASRSRNRLRLASMSSTMASITRPHSASSGSVAARMRAGIAAACSAGTLPLSASAFSELAACAIARSTAPGCASTISTRWPACAATCAMPAPIAPAPMTPTATLRSRAWSVIRSSLSALTVHETAARAFP